MNCYRGFYLAAYIFSQCFWFQKSYYDISVLERVADNAFSGSIVYCFTAFFTTRSSLNIFPWVIFTTGSVVYMTAMIQLV